MSEQTWLQGNKKSLTAAQKSLITHLNLAVRPVWLILSHYYATYKHGESE